MEKWDDLKEKLVELEQENRRIKFENDRMKKTLDRYAETLKKEVNTFFWLECQYDMLFEIIQERYGNMTAQELHREARKRKEGHQSRSKTTA